MKKQSLTLDQQEIFPEERSIRSKSVNLPELQDPIETKIQYANLLGSSLFTKQPPAIYNISVKETNKMQGASL